MFSTLGLFRNLPCPQLDICTRRNCLYSHTTASSNSRPLNLVPCPVAVPLVSQPRTQIKPLETVPAKRPAISPIKHNPTSIEPPRKLQKVGPTQRPAAVPSSSTTTESGVPILRISAAQSVVPLPVRQTMLKTLYDHFAVLYHKIQPLNPSLAADHALKQEAEVYERSTKTTYRNAVIQSVAILKRRNIPTSLDDPSVGTEGEIAIRIEMAKQLQTLCLSREKLEHLIHSLQELEEWGYIMDVPSGDGGTQSSIEGSIARCDRCPQYYLVKPLAEADQCIYHWGKPYTTRIGGEKVRIYTCCSRPVENGEGCSHGPHVFSESDPGTLHKRHPFSTLCSIDPAGPPKLDVAALDCEMIYTTGGLRVARVSIIDGSGNEVFDQLVSMDDGVEIIDYNTRFSGVTVENHATATTNLAGIRAVLNGLIDSNTILIGHGLENDLKTLRIVHGRCIDTALLFPHKAGKPFRRALKELVREKLEKLIQTGDGSRGHSSIEDAAATLDLIRWMILNNSKATKQPHANKQ